MYKGFRIGVFFLWLVLPMFAQQATVVRVIDGDTMEVRLLNHHTYKVRLLGVDAPEVARRGKEAEPFAQEATEFAKKHLLGKSVLLVNDGKKNEKDIYGRRLVYIEVAGRDFAHMLVEAGLARVYTQRRYRVSRTETYLKALHYAMQQQLGIWSISQQTKNSA